MPNPNEIKIVLTKEHYDEMLKIAKENCSDSKAAERIVERFLDIIKDAQKIPPTVLESTPKSPPPVDLTEHIHKPHLGPAPETPTKKGNK